MFFGKILIAVDDSVPSQYAIDVGLRVAREDGSAVIFGVALDPSLLGRDYAFASICELAEQIAADLVARAMKRANDLGVTASSEVLFRDATQGIIDLAKTQRVGLIAMGTHARTGIIRALNRSIAEEVLRRTTTPLCVVRRPATGKIHHRILVPVVDDDLSGMAVRYATEAARAFGSRLLFCTIEDGRSTTDSAAFLDLAKQQAAQSGVESDSVILPRESRIAAAILEQVHAEQCDMIIMASHGRDGLRRLMEGSVAETVIRSSETPVIVLRAEAQA
ncbi:MAG: UspA domain protein, partial [Candidatus Eremiobacteraeota bacterium]|nr:UspA domain protein [Candidatus Eremiobacteraeota bacterium]